MSDVGIAEVPKAAGKPSHPLIVRVTHWINAFAIVLMIGSGWRIYNASPLFGFRFDNMFTLGGWLGGALQWHFAAMWLFVLNALVYLIYGAVSGHFRRSFWPIRPREVLREFLLALQFKLGHDGGVYNAVQRLFYVGVIGAMIVVFLSGLAIWKPVQFQTLAALMGGYEGARIVHFVAMTAIVGFLIVHLSLVAIVPSTLWPMIWGGTPRGHDEGGKS
jgi:thiosulfate reductase cytochrome b subunit